MSTKTIIWILVIICIIAGGWWHIHNHAASMEIPASGTSSNTPATGVVQTTAPATDNTSVSATDTSDATLDQDLSNVDTQMNGLNSDTANADTGLNNPNQ